MQKLKRLYTLVTLFSNFLAVIQAHYVGTNLQYFRLWGGAVFKVVNTNNNLGTIIEVFYLKEYRDLEDLKYVVRPVVIDIGANIGTFTVWALRTLPNARVIAYEPESTNFRLLTENICLNNISSQTTAFKRAVGGELGERSLAIAGESSGKNSLSFEIGDGTHEIVMCTTLDMIFADNAITHCHCLKVDCEGAEYELLYGASAETLAKIDMIILEYHRVAGESTDKLQEFLRQHGFVIEISKLFSGMLTARRTTLTMPRAASISE